jgi:hypothetical protein
MLYNYIGYFSHHFNIQYEDLDVFAKKRLNVYNNALYKLKIFEPEFYNNVFGHNPDCEKDIMFNRSYLYTYFNDTNLPSNTSLLNIPKTLFLYYIKDLILKVQNVYETQIFNCNCQEGLRRSSLDNRCGCTSFDFCVHDVSECRCFIDQPIFQNLIRHITDEDLITWYENA